MSMLRLCRPATLGYSILLTFPSAFAASGSTLEETLITATYRHTQLMETVGSISVVSQDTIRERAALHLQDILNAAPNVTFAAGSSRSRFVQIRGIGDLEQYYDPKYYPSVGMMLDDLELGDSANAGMLFDVAQVEVLRGPQGTRYGASAHAGMINIRSNAPTDTFEGELSAGIGNYDSYNVGLVASGPLSNTMKGRLAIQQNIGAGYIENDNLGKDDTNDFDELTARTRLQWEPTENALYEFSLLYFDADNGYDTWSLDNNRHTNTDQPGEDAQETFALSTSANWVLNSNHSMEALFNYTETDWRQSYDVDWVSEQFCTTYLCSSGHDTGMEIFDRERERMVADVRLLGGNSNLTAGEGRYVIGLYANDGSENLDYDYPSIWYGNSGTDSDYQAQRYAVYGEYEHALSDRLTLIVGARLEHFEDDYGDSNGFTAKNSDDLWNGEVSIRYDLDFNTSVYATVARGSKPGGVNTTATANQPFMSPIFQDFTQGKLSFGDEELINKEIGLKTQLWDSRVMLSLAAFHTDRNNAQLENWMWDDDAGLWIGYLDSTSDATSYGIELETSLALSEMVMLFASVGWLNTEVDAIEAFDLDQFQFVTKSDRDQAKSPEYQYNIGAQLAFTEALSGRIEVEGQDDAFYGYYHDGKLNSYDLLNASLSWQASALSVTLWGRNLTDEDYAVHGLYFGADPRDNFGAFANTTYQQFGEPRTYGVELRYSF
ncbi:MAG: iron complex outermembrane receptor protein [Halioglobus sp.]|jgi:iron complex outermembrane receptor protein